MPRDLGQLVNSLGCEGTTLAEDALVTDAIVLLKCVGPDGGVSLYMAYSDGMSWIERLGMLDASAHAERRSNAAFLPNDD